jgi:hypothetical protein
LHTMPFVNKGSLPWGANSEFDRIFACLVEPKIVYELTHYYLALSPVEFLRATFQQRALLLPRTSLAALFSAGVLVHHL